MSLNKAMLIGNLGADPELRVHGETKICNLSIATSKKVKGESKTEWHRVTLFNRIAEIANEYTRKGSKVFIEGYIETQKWTDDKGIDRYTTKIIGQNLSLLDSKGDAPQPKKQPAPQQSQQFDDFDPDDIPF